MPSSKANWERLKGEFYGGEVSECERGDTAATGGGAEFSGE